MNDEIMGRQMFAQGSLAPAMQGGDMAMQGGDMAMQEGDMANVDMDQVAQGAMQQGVDPMLLESMLGDYAQRMEGMDNAEDYTTVIDNIRGDRLPLEARYAELAELVGPEDAQATPESVLALIQPIFQIAAVDEGIGGLAQAEMETPIEGPMAEGIMSTVDLGSREEAPPVNFSQGGAVTAPTLSELYEKKLPLYQAGDDFQADLEAAKTAAQSQAWFDVARGALAFASPGERQVSPAERLAQVAGPVLGSITARAQDFNKFKQGQKKEEQAIHFAALTSAEREKAASTLASAEQNKRYLKEQKRRQEVVKVHGTEGRTPFLMTRGEAESTLPSTAYRDFQAGDQTAIRQIEGAEEWLQNDGRQSAENSNYDDGAEVALLTNEGGAVASLVKAIRNTAAGTSFLGRYAPNQADAARQYLKTLNTVGSRLYASSDRSAASETKDVAELIIPGAKGAWFANPQVVADQIYDIARKVRSEQQSLKRQVRQGVTAPEGLSASSESRINRRLQDLDRLALLLGRDAMLQVGAEFSSRSATKPTSQADVDGGVTRLRNLLVPGKNTNPSGTPLLNTPFSGNVPRG